jgi:hypothetical protein
MATPSRRCKLGVVIHSDPGGNMTTRIGLLAATVAAGVAATATAVLPASGQGPAGARTLTYTSTERQRDSNAVDVKPKGDSVGDRFTFSSTLHQNGKVAGRIEADCVAVDRTYQGLQCSVVALFPNGRMTLQGAGLEKSVAGVGRVPEQYTVTGGTGAYASATGTMSRKAGGKQDTITFALSG